MNIVELINDSWGWKDIIAEEILKINDFGNILFRSTEGFFYRICPEELYLEKVANDTQEFSILLENREFIEDWNMDNLVVLAKKKFGNLKEGEFFCLKYPAVIGGEYNFDNLGKISLTGLISFSGDVSNQIKDVKDGEKVELKIINTP